MKSSVCIVGLVLLMGAIVPWSVSHAQMDAVHQLTDNNYVDGSPRINDHNHVVWWGFDGTDYEIFLYDGEAITLITDNTTYDSPPQINDSGSVVWAGWDGRDYEIYRYDGVTTTQVSDNSCYDSSPQINDGGYIVWEAVCGRADYEIFLYDGSAIIQLTDNEYHDSSPQINDYGLIVWEAYDGTDYEIFLYNGASTTQLTDNNHDDWSPRINNAGYVVWSGYDGTDYEIFLYDGTTITQLTDNDYDDWQPQINDSGQVVWWAQSSTANDIYYYDGSAVTHLTDNDYSDREPQINNNGYVVWVGHDGPGSEIFMGQIPVDHPAKDVYVDIKPGSCPNPLNAHSRGILVVAILGSADLEVSPDVDVTSLQLQGLNPVGYKYEDVAAPAEGEEPCACDESGPDGYLDLVMRFRTEEVAAAMAPTEDGDVIVLSVTGTLADGTPISGEDCVKIIDKKPEPTQKTNAIGEVRSPFSQGYRVGYGGRAENADP